MIRSKRLLVLALAVATTLTAAQSSGQQDPVARALDAQIGRIFVENAYALPRFGLVKWRPDGVSYTVLEPAQSRAGAFDIVQYDSGSGSRRILVTASQLVPAGRSAPLSIEDYEWSNDGNRLLMFTNTKRVWRRNTRGDYWVLEPGNGRLWKLGRSAPESSLMFAKFSPDGSRVAYVRSNNIWVEHLSEGRINRITSDGSEAVINGTSDWVYEEELGVRDGFRWSPDGREIAYWRFDTTGVGEFSLIDNTDTLYPVVTRFPYPKVGTTNSAVRIGVVSAAGGKTRWLQLPGDPRQTYLARLDWVDEHTLAMQHLNRLQNRNDFLLGDARNGKVTRVFTDESKTWVDVVDEVRWVDRGSAFLWLSERDGWRHVYRVPRHGGDPILVTRLDADVIDLAGLDESGGWFFFLASPDDATQQYLYRSRLDGTGTPERLTPSDRPGTHAYTVAPGGRFAFHLYSRFEVPTVTELIELPRHRTVKELTDTSELRERLTPVLTPPVEFFRVEVPGGVLLDGWMLKPPHFDAARRYPVIVHVYGEPAGQTVVDRWGGNRMLFHRALAEAGYVVVSVDNRGTPAPKGAAWRKVVYGAVGELSSKEQAAAVRALTARHQFLDPERIGIWGWSGGGSSTLNAMFRFPDVYRVGVSVAPVPDQKLYDTIYQERYMGLPQDNADGYRRGSPINFAEGLRGNLLVVHGTGDDNVHFQGTEKLINRLVELGKPFDVMVYPNRTHAIAEGPGTTPHLYRLIARYFFEHLPPGPR